jgi:hypothetical protein
MAVSPIKSLFVERSLSLFFSGPLCTLKCDTVWTQSASFNGRGKDKKVAGLLRRPTRACSK